jgi:membrane protein CcdC involved in cytochrome C biogenesis
MEWILGNKEVIVTIITALLTAVGLIVRLTASKKDDSVYNKIVRTIGLGNLAVPVAAPVEWPNTDEEKPGGNSDSV